MTIPGPPILGEVLEHFLSNKRLPICMPQRPCEAAQWWINMQKPPVPSDKPRLIFLQGAEGQQWETPHIERITFNLRRFLTLSLPDQKYIIGARNDGVWWNGDNIDFFYRVVDETMLMQEMGREVYIKRALQMMRGVINKQTEAV